VDEIADERPAHGSEEYRVAAEGENHLGRGHRPGRGRAAGTVPGQEPEQDAGENGGGESESVGEPPRPGAMRRAQIAGRDRLRPPVGAGPAQPEARPRATELAGDVERLGSAGEGDRGLGGEGIALRPEQHVSAHAHDHSPPALHPQPVGARPRHAQRPRPSDRPLPGTAALRQIASDQRDRARSRPSHEPSGTGDVAGQPGRTPEGDQRREAGSGDPEPRGQRPPASPSPLASRERRETGKEDGGQGERQRPHLERRLRVDRPPPENREDEEGDAQGEADPGEAGS
jgi:hypothetical protein